MIAITCASCGVVFDVPNHFAETRQRDHETFYCPNGHPLNYYSKTKEEKRIAELEKQLERVRHDTTERFHDLLKQRNEWEELAKRCPMCGDHVAARMRVPENITARLVEHLRDEHGAVPRRRALTRGDAAA